MAIWCSRTRRCDWRARRQPCAQRRGGRVDARRGRAAGAAAPSPRGMRMTTGCHYGWEWHAATADPRPAGRRTGPGHGRWIGAGCGRGRLGLVRGRDAGGRRGVPARIDGDVVRALRRAAAGQVDLLTVLAHELGHLRGLGHEHGDAHQVMSPTLPLGVRRLPPSTPVYQAAVDH